MHQILLTVFIFAILLCFDIRAALRAAKIILSWPKKTVAGLRPTNVLYLLCSVRRAALRAALSFRIMAREISSGPSARCYSIFSVNGHFFPTMSYRASSSCIWPPFWNLTPFYCFLSQKTLQNQFSMRSNNFLKKVWLQPNFVNLMPFYCLLFRKTLKNRFSMWSDNFLKNSSIAPKFCQSDAIFIIGCRFWVHISSMNFIEAFFLRAVVPDHPL